MRKLVRNGNQHLAKLYKTPEPTINDGLRSPRFVKSPHQQPRKPRFEPASKHKYSMETLKTNPVQNQQREQSQTKQPQVRVRIDSATTSPAPAPKRIPKHTPTAHEANNPYLLLSKPVPAPSFDTRQPNNSQNGGLSRRSSTNSQYNESEGKNRGTQQSMVRQLANTNMRLKHENMVLRDRIAKLEEDIGSHAQQNKNIRRRLTTLERTHEQLVQKQDGLMLQVRNIRRQLSLSEKELQQFRAENYLMKQQLHLLAQPKPHPTETTLESLLDCPQCDTLTQAVQELTAGNENLRYQLWEKAQVVAGLCSEVAKLEAEARLLDRPRQAAKKLMGVIEGLNSEILGGKLRDINRKYTNR